MGQLMEKGHIIGVFCVIERRRDGSVIYYDSIIRGGSEIRVIILLVWVDVYRKIEFRILSEKLD